MLASDGFVHVEDENVKKDAFGETNKHFYGA